MLAALWSISAMTAFTCSETPKCIAATAASGEEIHLPVQVNMVPFKLTGSLTVGQRKIICDCVCVLDVDECALGSDCDSHARCLNTDGSYTCTCIHPYSGDGKNCTGNWMLML